MYLNIIIKIIIIIAIVLTLNGPVSARVEISDFFSDFTSGDVTLTSSEDFQGKAVFELLYVANPVETHEVELKINAGESVNRVILWQIQPLYDYYTARVGIYDKGKLLESRTYQVSYGTVSLPNFHVVDFSPTNSGAQLLLRPFNPSAVDIRIELIENNSIVYSDTKKDQSLITNTEIKMLWPFLLTNNKNYIVRAKIFTHRLYSRPLINTYIANFTATDDIEILIDDVEVDEYGASVTIRGESQVPFDGFIVVTARNRATNETFVFRQQVEEILVSGKEDTAGVVWRGLPSGTYDVEIQAVNQENITIDKYETALRIPEYSNVTKTVPAKSTSGFEAVILIIVLLAGVKRFKGV